MNFPLRTAFAALYRFCMAVFIVICIFKCPPWFNHWSIFFSLSSMFLCVCALNCSAVSTLHDHMDYSPPGYSVHEIFQTRILAAKLLQSCPTLCNPIDGSPPGSPVPGILQARTLEWVAICFSNAWKWKMKVKSLSRVWLLATPWTAAYQAPLPMGFSRKEYWSGLLFPSPRGLSDPGIKAVSPALQTNSLPLSHLGRIILNIIVLNMVPISYFLYNKLSLLMFCYSVI